MARVLRLGILDTYGVRWDAETLARDVYQNFFDAAHDFEQIAVEANRKARSLEVRGPAEFDLDLLAYLGATTKTDGTTAGGFGEGFKIVALLALRDFGLRLRAASGKAALEAFFDPVPLGRELCYRVSTRRSGAGSLVRLEGVSDEVFAAFDAARSSFVHPNNPKLGAIIAEGDGASVRVAKLGCQEGELYYRRQLRGRVRYRSFRADPPITLLCDAPDDSLEGDRDRRDLDPRAVALVVAARLPPEGVKAVLLALVYHWTFGHEVLDAVIDAAVLRGLRFDFASGYLARSGKPALDSLAERQGFHLVVRSFAKIGMRTAEQVYTRDLETRAPRPRERGRLEGLADLYAALLEPGSPLEDLEKRPRFEVFDSNRAAVLGQHLGEKVIVASKLISAKGNFASAGSTVLHELAHVRGGETSDGFLNALSTLLSRIFERPRVVERARHAFARPKLVRAPPAELPPVAPAYRPELEFKHRRGGLIDCRVFVPHAFPPTAELIRRVDAVVDAEAPYSVYVAIEAVTPGEARSRKLPGLPAVLVDEKPVGPPPLRRPGYYLRLHGDAELLPTEAMLRDAIAEARRERERKKAEGEEKPVIPAGIPTWARQFPKRLDLSYWLTAWAGYGRLRGLERLWPASKDAACKWRLRALEEGPEDDDTLYQRILKEVLEHIVASRVLRSDAKDFEAGDPFDEPAMGAAQGAYVAGAAASGKERGARDFHAVRAAAGSLLAADFSSVVRETALIHALRVGGLQEYLYGPTALDAERFNAELEAIHPLLSDYQRALDSEGGWPNPYALTNLLSGRHKTLAAQKREARAEAAKKQEEQRLERKHALATHAVKAAYEATLEKTGDPIEAARVALEAARRIPPAP